MRRAPILAAVFGFVILTAYTIIANPLNFFVRQSSRFSEESFLSLEQGSQISKAIQLLGEPLDVKGGGANCPGCKVYYFMGDPPPWLHFYKEAWITAGPDGKIISTVLNSEP
jgi:hypothetical protein